MRLATDQNDRAELHTYDFSYPGVCASSLFHVALFKVKV